MQKVDSNNYRMLFKYAAYAFYKNKYATHELHKNSYINSWILFFELYNLIERQVDRGGFNLWNWSIIINVQEY